MIIHTDASCGDGAIGVGYTIRVGDELYEGSTIYEGSYTSMEAEYLALKEAAQSVVRFFDCDEHLFIYTDCAGLVDKMEEPNDSDKWNQNRNELLSILSELPEWSMKWIPRERNRDADSLASQARNAAVS